MKKYFLYAVGAVVLWFVFFRKKHASVSTFSDQVPFSNPVDKFVGVNPYYSGVTGPYV